jgi:hypothetical protein
METGSDSWNHNVIAVRSWRFAACNLVTLMASKKPPKKEKQPAKPPHMPFDDALRVLLNTKPQPRAAPKKKKA